MLRTFGAEVFRKMLVGSRSLLLLLAFVFVCDHTSAQLAYEYREDGTAGVCIRDYDEKGNDISYVGPINIPEKVVKDGRIYVVTEILPGECSGEKLRITSLYIPKTIKKIWGNFLVAEDSGQGTGTLEELVFDAEDCECVGVPEKLRDGTSAGIWWNGYAPLGCCSNLKSVKIGANVKRIPDAMFMGLEHLESVVIPESVTHIGYLAFAECPSLKSITIPRNVTYIGDSAFKNCTGLTSVTFNAEACTYVGDEKWFEPFEYCKNLTTLTIGENVTMSPDYAFWRMKGKIKEVVIPNSVKTIGCYAFEQTGIESLILGNSVTTIGKYAFEGCGIKSLSLGNSVTTIEDGAFYDNDISSVSIPNSVRTIGRSAFYYCGIKSLSLGNSVTTIGRGAFMSNDISSVTIPNSVTTISSVAFYNNNFNPKLSVVFNAENCNTVIDKNKYDWDPKIYIDPVFDVRVTSLVIGDKVKKIPYYLFAGCDFKEVVIPYSVKEIGDSAFLNCRQLEYAEIENPMTRIGKHAFGGCTRLKTASIPETATEIEDGTYYGCEALESVTIPKTAKKIGRVAFFGCSSLSNVAMGDSIETVGDKAFGDCKRLESFTLGEHAKAIGAEAFAGCAAMKSLAVFAAVPPECGDEAFKGVDVSACTLSVPEASIELYKAAPQWKEFLKVSAIGNIVDDESAILYDVYNLQGIMVGRNLTEAEITADMPHGVYILVSPQGRKKLKI